MGCLCVVSCAGNAGRSARIGCLGSSSSAAPAEEVSLASKVSRLATSLQASRSVPSLGRVLVRSTSRSCGRVFRAVVAPSVLITGCARLGCLAVRTSRDSGIAVVLSRCALRSKVAVSVALTGAVTRVQGPVGQRACGRAPPPLQRRVDVLVPPTSPVVAPVRWGSD